MSEQATYTEHVYQEYSCGDMCEPIYQREEIVRCRDCKYANEDGDKCVYFAAWEPLPEGDEFRDVYVDVEPNGFCAWGEREDGDAR